MFRITSDVLTKSDRKIVRQYAQYVIDRFVSKERQKEFKVEICFVDPNSLEGKERKELKKYQAWMYVYGKDYIVWISTTTIGSAKHPIKRLKNALLCIGHELVHVKQYVNKQLTEVDGKICWEGKILDFDFDEQFDNLEEYYFTPFEIEAYGLEYALYDIFTVSLAGKTRRSER